MNLGIYLQIKETAHFANYWGWQSSKLEGHHNRAVYQLSQHLFDPIQFPFSSCLKIISGILRGLSSHPAKGEHILPVSRRNILCIFKLVYGVGLRALRKLFMEINHAWSNQPSDAAAFDRGRMKLNKEEEVIFNNGNIIEWDFSLITTVLLYSKVCAFEISKRPGYDFALRELKSSRNKLLGHPSSEQMSDEDFDIFWPLLSTHFVTLGADQAEIAEIKLQSGNYICNSL